MASIEQMTAEQLRKKANILGEGTDLYPTRSMENVVEPVANRPSVGDLYDKLNVLNRKPLDYSGITDVNKQRGEQGDREWLGGLAMQMMGGKTIAPAGKHVFEKALEKQNPIRPNAADVGWTKPDTGEFVENPQTARVQEEKLITGRIDAIIKEEESKARIALAAGNAAAADVAKANAEDMKRILAAIALQNSNNKGVQIQFIGDKAHKAGTKPLLHAEQKDLKELSDNFAMVDRLEKSFKPEYAGGWTGTAGAELQNNVMRNFPKAAGTLMSKAGKEKAREQAEFWANQKFFDEMPTRHANFGSALTAPEIASWNSAAIRAGMDEGDIRHNIALRKTIFKNAAAKMREMHIENGKPEAAVDAMLRGILGTPAPATEVSGQPNDADAALLKKYPNPRKP